MRKIIILTLMAAISILMAGCQNLPNVNPSLEPQAQIPQMESYPSPQTASIPAYPGPNGKIETPAIRPGQPEPTPLADAPNPLPGKSSFSGTIYSYTIQMVLPLTTIYLTPGLGEDATAPLAFIGPEESKGDIVLQTDKDGNIIADNIEPGEYYLATMAPLNWAAAVNSPRDETLRKIALKPDEKNALGIIYVSWP